MVNIFVYEFCHILITNDFDMILVDWTVQYALCVSSAIIRYIVEMSNGKWFVVGYRKSVGKELNL